MATVLITGGTGMIGQQLTSLLLQKGYEVVLLTRKITGTEPTLAGVRYALWNPVSQTIDTNALSSADHIIHLAGAGVADKRWTEARKKEILLSRTQSSQLLVQALAAQPNKVQSIVSASAIGWYGPDGAQNPNEGFTEDCPHYPDFLGTTCYAWEQSMEPVVAMGKRLVRLRIGIVLSKTGGALTEFKKPLRMGVAAILGNGRQIISWIHIEDLCRLFVFAMEQQQLTGVYNAVAPHPVSNRELTLTLAREMNGRFFMALPVPSLALKLLLGEMSIEVLKSTTVNAAKIMSAGFLFHYPTIDRAIANS